MTRGLKNMTLVVMPQLLQGFNHLSQKYNPFLLGGPKQSLRRNPLITGGEERPI